MSDYIKRGAIQKALIDLPADLDAKTVQRCIETVHNFPAADVRENVHAHWAMLSFDEAVCTACGYNRNTHFDSTKEAKELWDELPPFCEMCGAIMDEEAEQ